MILLTTCKGGFPELELITDRTQSDANRLAALNAKGWNAMTSEERQYWLNGNAVQLYALDGPLYALDGPLMVREGVIRGAYNTEDYNRVGVALNYLSDWLFDLGYGFNPKLRTNWATNENFTPNDGLHYLSTIKQVRDSFVTLPTMPPLPSHIHDLFLGMGFVWANNIEQLLLDIEFLITNMSRTINLGWALGIAHIGLYGGAA